MNGRRLLGLALVVGVAFWLWKSGKVSEEGAPATTGSPASSSAAPGSAGWSCLTAAEEASRLTQDAATVLLRTPIDPAAFSTASQTASSAISTAESRCGGGGSAGEQRAMEEARAALSEMRALLADFAGALSGSGSASDAPRRREAIDARLDAARAALRG